MNDTPKLTLLVEPDSLVLARRAARALITLGLPASGAFLTAAEVLIERGEEVTEATLANALHEQ